MNQIHADVRAANGGPLARRRAGVLLHPTSLPGAVLDQEAYHFVEFLAAAGQSVWQTLPLGPTHGDLSPYQCLSVFAGNPGLISMSSLAQAGWLDEAALRDAQMDDDESRRQLMSEALAGFRRHGTDADGGAFSRFRQQQGDWLDDFALYQALRCEHGGNSWLDWPAALRDRDTAALDEARRNLQPAIERVCFEQFVFERQWLALKRFANERGVLMFGDMPIFVAHDSAEVWAQRHYFTLDENGRALTVAGVPPDYFSETGQYWGNPHYRWDRMREDGFIWWRKRLAHQLTMFDLVRIDHFRGFEAFWEIPANAATAMEGRWVTAPGDALFQSLQNTLPPSSLVAEDLGVITPAVDALRRKYGLPGMKILQFAFGSGADNPYLPHNHEPDYVVYTGTHDNSTTLGWFNALGADARREVLEYLGAPREHMPWPLIRSAYQSVARLAVIPMQDVLGLDDQHRMNVPGVTQGNWRWRFVWNQVPTTLAARMRRLTALYGRDAGG